MRKSQADPMKLIVVAVILLIAMVVMIVVFRNIFGKEAKLADEKITGVGTDSDRDGVVNLFDACPYNADIQKREDIIDKEEGCKCDDESCLPPYLQKSKND